MESDQELSQKAGVEAFVPKYDLELEVVKYGLKKYIILIQTYRRHS